MPVFKLLEDLLSFFIKAVEAFRIFTKSQDYCYGTNRKGENQQTYMEHLMFMGTNYDIENELNTENFNVIKP